MYKLSNKNSLSQALVIKSKALGETDKVVTLLTMERGKFVCTAKGVRQMKSSRKACLESGNLARVYLIETKSGWPLLTQANLVCDCEEVRGSLPKIKQLMQFLEVVDKVFVEEELEGETFAKVLMIRKMILAGNYPARQIKEQLYELVEMMGFQVPADELNGVPGQPKPSVLDYVAELTNQKMKSFNYLSVE